MPRLFIFIITFSFFLFCTSIANRVSAECFQRGFPGWNTCMSDSFPKSCANGADSWFWCCTLQSDTCPTLPIATPTPLPAATITPPPFNDECPDPIRGCTYCEWNTTNCSHYNSPYNSCNPPYFYDSNACHAYDNDPYRCQRVAIPCTTVVYNYYCAGGTAAGCTPCPNNVCPPGATVYSDYAQCLSSCNNLSTLCAAVGNAHCDTPQACIDAGGVDKGRIDCALGVICCQYPISSEPYTKYFCDPYGSPTSYAGPPTAPYSINTGIGCLSYSGKATIQSLLNWGIGVGSGISLLFTALSGIQIIFAGGDPKKIKAGQELLVSALTGLGLIVLCVVFLNFIGVTVLGLPHFKI